MISAQRSRLVGSVVVAVTVVLFAVVGLAGPAAGAGPEGQLTWGVHFSLAPTWLDPAETPAMITPFLTLYALHDAVAKPMPGNPMAPNLAESWSVSKDGLAYEFVLRKNVRFHNGDVLTADDVKFSYERYKGGSATRDSRRRRWAPARTSSSPSPRAWSSWSKPSSSTGGRSPA